MKVNGTALIGFIHDESEKERPETLKPILHKGRGI